MTTRPTPRPWSEDDLAALQCLHAQGLRIADIGIRLDRTASAVWTRLREARLRRRASRIGSGGQPIMAFEIPSRCRNDDAHHLQLVSGNRPGGFPALNLPAHYRIAA